MAGTLIGSILILKLTSATFAHKIGLLEPITTPFVVLFVFGVLILIPTIVLHFKFNETILES